MKTWLVTWNPARYAWDNPYLGYAALRREIALNGSAAGGWTCSNTKSIRKGDRVFLLKQGARPRGIVAGGYAASDSYGTPHPDPVRAAAGKAVQRVDILWDRILDIDAGEIFPQDILKILGPGYNWSPMGSGVSVPDEIAQRIEEVRKKDFMI